MVCKDAVVVGGGLAGLLTTIRLLESGNSVILVDEGLPDANGALGGFAKFSGAKFSLPPAGMGLVKPAGSEENLFRAIDNVLAILGLARSMVISSSDEGFGGSLRKYDSIVLTPAQIDQLVENLSVRIRGKAGIVSGTVRAIKNETPGWTIDVHQNGQKAMELSAGAVFFAAVVSQINS